MPKMEHKAIAAEFKAVKSEEDEGTGIIEGYGSVFGTRDSYGDIVAKGAFKNSLKSGRTVPILWQHRQDKPLGIWDELKEDDTGLFVKGRINLKTSYGNDAYELMKDGVVTGLSIGFVTKQREWDEEGETRTLTEVDLFEVSAVTIPANPDAQTTSIKTFDTLADIDDLDLVGIERTLRQAGLSREESKRIMRRHQDLILKAREQEAAEEGLSKLLKSLRS